MHYWPAFVVVLSSLLVRPVLAHEGHDHDHQHTGGSKAAKFPAGIVLPAVKGPAPWSDKPLLDDPDRFQIAIMTDNTGGHRPGIWMKAVERINLLRPAFVMSVGDLIEGYSTDPKELSEQWKEFLGFIDKMQMKFFFVAGNHDLSNPLAHEVWRKHFGLEWYSFDYKGVHFVCLSSEDPHDRIGPEQLAWLEGDLKQHADARWTLLFFHKPLWTMSERAIAAGNPDETNWQKVEAALSSRPHTVFAGHVHHYVQYDRRGMKYYHLGTTGGASKLRGIAYGEFDHIAWLTMEPEGPTVVNLLLDGIVPANTVTEKGIARFREFLAKARLEVAPILVDSDAGISSGRIDLRLKNTFDTPVQVAAEIDGLPLRGLTVEQGPVLKLTAAPGETKMLAVEVQFNETVAFEHFAQTLLTAKVRSADVKDGEPPLTAELTLPVVIDRKYSCPIPQAAIAIDGDPNEWPALSLASGDSPLVVGESKSWQGAGDAAVRFGTAHDDKYIYVAAEVTDDRILAGDKLELRLDGRSISDRRAAPVSKSSRYLLSIPAPEQEGVVAKIAVQGSPVVGTANVATRRTKTGWTVEAALPISVVKSQGKDWHSFQMTPVIVDVDDSDDSPANIIWRGTASYSTANTNFGQFVRSEE